MNAALLRQVINYLYISSVNPVLLLIPFQPLLAESNSAGSLCISRIVPFYKSFYRIPYRGILPASKPGSEKFVYRYILHHFFQLLFQHLGLFDKIFFLMRLSAKAYKAAACFMI